MKNLFLIDNIWTNIDTSSLDNYSWNTFKESKYPRLSRLPYTHRRPKWEDDAPSIALTAYNKSIEAFKKINPNCNIITIEKCLIQKNLAGNIMGADDIHQDDIRENRWSALWFIQGDGNTRFFEQCAEDTQIAEAEFKPGTVAIFPSDTWHGPGFSSTGWRIIINTVFHVENLT